MEVPSADADTEELQFESPPPASGDEGSSSSQERLKRLGKAEQRCFGGERGSSGARQLAPALDGCVSWL